MVKHGGENGEREQDNTPQIDGDGMRVAIGQIDQVQAGDTVFLRAVAIEVNGQIMVQLGGVPDRIFALHEVWFAAAGVPGPLRRKFDGGRGAMLDENDRIVGYYNPPNDQTGAGE